MQTFLIALAILISIIIVAMIIFGICYIIVNVQVELIYRVVDELWDHCSMIYYYMDDDTKEVFKSRLKNELNIEPEKIEFELEADDSNHTILKRLLASIPLLYEKYDKKLESSCLIARDIAYGSEEEVREVTNIINSVLKV